MKNFTIVLFPRCGNAKGSSLWKSFPSYLKLEKKFVVSYFNWYSKMKSNVHRADRTRSGSCADISFDKYNIIIKLFPLIKGNHCRGTSPNIRLNRPPGTFYETLHRREKLLTGCERALGAPRSRPVPRPSIWYSLLICRVCPRQCNERSRIELYIPICIDSNDFIRF